MPADLKILKKQKEAEYLNKLYFYLDSSDEIKSKDLSLPKMDRVILKVIEKGMEEGNFQCLDFLFNRTIGKVADHIHQKISLEDQKTLEDSKKLKELPREKLIELTENAIEVLKKDTHE